MGCPFVMYILVVAKTKADIYHLREDKKLGSQRSVLHSNRFGFPEIPRLWLTTLSKAAEVCRKQMQRSEGGTERTRKVETNK